jgi:hypothetical protein
MEFAILREVQEDILFGIKKQRESRSSYQAVVILGRIEFSHKSGSAVRLALLGDA